MLDDIPAVITTENTPWARSQKPRVAGVSSFGMSGTNAHIIMEEAPVFEKVVSPTADPEGKKHLLPVSARGADALKEMAKAYKKWLGENPEAAIADLTYSASLHRSHHDYRLTVAASTAEEMLEGLDAFLGGNQSHALSVGQRIPGQRKKVVFVFPGQGSQWLGMGRELMETEPVFQEAMERVDEAINKHAGFSMKDELYATEEHSRLDQVDVIQPAIFAMQYCLAALWRSWGVEPDAVIGHSMGEVGAAAVAGALDLDDAARIICGRSKLVKRASGKGVMAFADMSAEDAQEALKGYEGRLDLAAINGPTTCLLAGEPGPMDELLEKLKSQDIFCRLVKVDYASHCVQMDPLRPDLLKALKGIKPRAGDVPVYSTVTHQIEDGSAFSEDYWAKNLRQTVLFGPAVEKLVEDGHNIFIEISPHPVILPSIESGLKHWKKEGDVVQSLRREESESTLMHSSLGKLHCLGYSVDFNHLYPVGGTYIQLPNYRWQHEEFWIEQKKSSGRNLVGSGHPLLGMHVESAHNPGTHIWEMDIGLDEHPYLSDHRVQGVAILPGTAYLEIAVAAAKDLKDGDYILENVTLQKAMVLREAEFRTVQVVLTAQEDDSLNFSLFSREGGVGSEWTLHSDGTVHVAKEVGAGAGSGKPGDLQTHLSEELSSTDHYNAMLARGLEYGPNFQGLEDLRRADGSLIANIKIPESISDSVASYYAHPAIMDVCFQTILDALPPEVSDATYLPVNVGSIQVRERLTKDMDLWGSVDLRAEGDGTDTFEGHINLMDADGRVLVEVKSLRVQRLDAGNLQNYKDWLYEIQWSEQELEPGEPTSDEGVWVIFTDLQKAGEELAGRLKARKRELVLVSKGDSFKELKANHYEIGAG